MRVFITVEKSIKKEEKDLVAIINYSRFDEIMRVSIIKDSCWMKKKNESMHAKMIRW